MIKTVNFKVVLKNCDRFMFVYRLTCGKVKMNKWTSHDRLRNIMLHHIIVNEQSDSCISQVFSSSPKLPSPRNSLTVQPFHSPPPHTPSARPWHRITGEGSGCDAREVTGSGLRFDARTVECCFLNGHCMRALLSMNIDGSILSPTLFFMNYSA